MLFLSELVGENLIQIESEDGKEPQVEEEHIEASADSVVVIAVAGVAEVHSNLLGLKHEDIVKGLGDGSVGG